MSKTSTLGCIPCGVGLTRSFHRSTHAVALDTPGEFPIRPGMTTTVDIRTGNRTVLEFLLKPVMRLRFDSLHES